MKNGSAFFVAYHRTTYPHFYFLRIPLSWGNNFNVACPKETRAEQYKPSVAEASLEYFIIGVLKHKNLKMVSRLIIK